MSEIIIRAVGDNLIHKQLYKAARKGESYDFNRMYDRVTEKIKQADVAVINQETILVKDHAKVSSFPAFGSPAEIAEAVVNAGFNVVTHASNHARDKWKTGIQDSCDIWKKYRGKVIMTGVFDSKQDSNTLRIIEKKGCKIAILNYTEKLNYHPLPLTRLWSVSVLKNWNKRRIKQQIEEAKQKADFVIVFPHWGCEYLYEPVLSQENWAGYIAECGADLIIGTHPHVLQPVALMETTDHRTVPCYYSLGNFISCQVKPGTMLGGMAEVKLAFDEKTHQVTILENNLLPLVTHTDKEYSFFETYLLRDYNDELAKESRMFDIVRTNYGVTVNCAYLEKLFADIMDRKAQAYNEFKTPGDVTRSNMKGVFNALTGKNVK